MFTSDWHIHTIGSWDAKLLHNELFESAAREGITEFGVADHINWPSWSITFLQKQEVLYERFKRPNFHFGVELTTISKYKHDYDKARGDLGDWVDHNFTDPDPIELPLTLQEIKDAKLEYVIGAAHWELNVPNDIESIVKDFFRQNMYLACDERIDIVGHPFAIAGQFVQKDGTKAPFNDFSLITPMMRNEFAAALKENGKQCEYNLHFAMNENLSEEFKYKYAEWLRELFEMGIDITIGSDCHGPQYTSNKQFAEKYLKAAGFKTEDFAKPNFRQY